MIDYLRRDRELNGQGEVERLAVKIQMSPSRLRQLLKGDLKHTLRIDNAMALAEALGTDLNGLFHKTEAA